MARAVRIGGAAACVLSAEPPDPGRPAFVGATVLPGRGMMLLQAQLRLPSGDVVEALAAPGLAAAARLLDGGPEDFAGNRSFSFGGAILAPFANRIRGRPQADARQIETNIAGRRVRLPRNWGGKAPGAEQYAMHGLILDAPAQVSRLSATSVDGQICVADGTGGWPGPLTFDVNWALDGGALSLAVRAVNSGNRPVPVAIGWHPYFKLASGDRAAATLHLPARSRVLVNNYDEVLPTGELQPVAGTPYDFTSPRGRALGDTYLDDCFTELERKGAAPLAELRDAGAGLGLRLISPSPEIRAIQVYAPVDHPYVVIEPQFNLADPYGVTWGAQETGMVELAPGGSTTYAVRVEPFAFPSGAARRNAAGGGSLSGPTN